MSAFDWADPFDLESQLTEEERLVEKTAHDYAQKRLAPRVLEVFRHERTDPTIFREMGELGFLGPTISPDFGGSGLGYVSYGLIAREIERIDLGYRSMMSVQSSLVMVPIEAFGSLAQKQKYLPKLAQRRMDRLLRPHRAGPRLRPGSMVTRAKKIPGRLFASPARRRGSPTRRSPTCSSFGRRPKTASSAASSWRRAPRASAPLRPTARWACAPRSPARSCSTKHLFPRRTCCRRSAASRVRSLA